MERGSGGEGGGPGVRRGGGATEAGEGEGEAILAIDEVAATAVEPAAAIQTSRGPEGTPGGLRVRHSDGSALSERTVPGRARRSGAAEP